MRGSVGLRQLFAPLPAARAAPRGQHARAAQNAHAAGNTCTGLSTGLYRAIILWALVSCSWPAHTRPGEECGAP